MFDYLIVGAGLYGATFAQQAMERGKSCVIIDKRDHIGGNCYTDNVDGINVHRYGPHQFHTNDKRVWDYVNRFAEFNHFRAHVPVSYQGRLYSMPPNLRLFHQLWGVTTPEQARRRIEEDRIPYEKPKNFEEWVVSQVGVEIYESFYKGYTSKQWGRDPKELPASTARRLPIRFTWNDRWFEDPYEGIPVGGYTRMIENMIDGATVLLNVDYFADRDELNRSARNVVYSGKIDQFFDYKYGELEYRSLRFETKTLDQEDYQGNAIVNYSDAAVPYTRVVEHKHFEFTRSPKTIVTWEFPDSYDRSKTPYYSVNNAETNALYERYKKEWSMLPNFTGGGRLFDFKYYNMDQTIAAALSDARRTIMKD